MLLEVPVLDLPQLPRIVIRPPKPVKMKLYIAIVISCLSAGLGLLYKANNGPPATSASAPDRAVYTWSGFHRIALG